MRGLALSSLLGFSQASLGEYCRVEGTSELKTMPHELSESDLVIMELERQTCRHIKAGKIDELMDTDIAEHGVIVLDKGGIGNGLEAQRRVFKEFFAAGYALVYEPADARTSRAGDMAWAVDDYQLTMANGV